jgi:hypothetical protein
MKEISLIPIFKWRVAWLSESELAHSKSLPNKNDHMLTKTETNEFITVQSLRLKLHFPVYFAVFNNFVSCVLLKSDKSSMNRAGATKIISRV